MNMDARAQLTLHPLETPAGPGWIGLSGGAVVWLSLGQLDDAAVARYWRGAVTRGGPCPLAPESLVRAAAGEGSPELRPAGTPFQRQVWEGLRRIPFATTRTYGELAAGLGRPGSVRAVAGAVAANPIAWLVPCHRVVPAAGGAGGYRWGAAAKQRLQEWEAGAAPVGTSAGKRRKLEAMLVNAQRFEDIARLAGDIAHDLNNLLAPIRMATDLLRRRLTDNALDRYVEIIDSSTGRARSVIQEILSFSRESEGKEPTELEINPVLNELERLVRDTFPARVRTAFALVEPSPRVRMDPTQLHRAVLNILVNARDAIAGDGEIRLRVSRHDLEMKVCVGERCLLPGRYVCISVSDTGCGVPEHLRERIFDPFFTTKPKEEGTGLGLASVYGIIARAGGFIDLESTVGAGSTFHLFLPELHPAAG